MDMARVREYVRLRRQQRERETETEAIKEQADQIEAQLLEEFAVDGVQSMSVDGMTVYLSRQLWASIPDGVEKEQVIDGLKSAGLEHFVRENYNTQTLSSWMRDLEREDESLPEPLQGLLTGSERYNLRVRRS